jgi:putative transcriptional regulator
MIPNHHPHPDTLMCYVAGTLSNATSCIVACHLSLCRDCADHVRRLEVLGGLMLKNLEAGPTDNAFTERAAAQWSSKSLISSGMRHDTVPNTGDPLLPLPLERYLGMRGSKIPWKTVVNGVREYGVELPKGSGQMRLLRLLPGNPLLEEAHPGTELILVLQGRCRDHTGDYVRGDVIEWTEDSRHQMRVSGDQECVILVASEVMPADLVRRDRASQKSHRKPFTPGLRFRKIRDLTPALAASVAMIVGIGLGWLLHGGTAGNVVALDDLVQIESSRLIARGALQSTLEASPSGGQKVETSSDGRQFHLSVKMTFQNAAGDYCREYRIVSASRERYAGVACRSGGLWAVKIQALLPPSRSASEQMIPAGGNTDAAMDTAIGALIDGDPLAGADEAALLSKGWKK